MEAYIHSQKSLNPQTKSELYPLSYDALICSYGEAISATKGALINSGTQLYMQFVGNPNLLLREVH